MKRQTRDMWALKQARPVRSEMINADVVETNTNEAKAILASKGVVTKVGTIAGRKALIIWHEGINYLWIAGYLDGKSDDDLPIPPKP